MSCARPLLLLVASAALALATGCASKRYIPNTTVVDTADNREILEAIESYRQRMLEKNVEGLLLLASPRYFEDSGTPRADDDYGYDGLKQVLTSRLVRVRSLRYEIQYRNINVKGDRAEAEVFIKGAFELAAHSGDRYRPVSDYHRFVLERVDDRWRFLSGM
jgi:hypothetical protein